MNFRIAIVLGFLALPVCPAGAQTAKSRGPWTGTITTNINRKDTDFAFESSMNCDLKVSSTRCTYKSTMKISGKNPAVITESATQDHLQLSIIPGAGEWKMRVAAFMSTGTKTVTANGKSLSGEANIHASNWEFSIPAPRDPNNLVGSWKNSDGVIQWNLSR
jgi:hypothetical protein